MWGLRTLPSMWSASLQCSHCFYLCAQCQQLSPQQPGKSGTWKTVTNSLNPHSSPVTGFIVVPVLWMMRGWISRLRFQRQRCRIWALAVWLQPLIPNYTAYRGSASLWEAPSAVHCLCSSPWGWHVDGWVAVGGLVNEQKGRDASKGNWTHGTQDTCFWHQHSGSSSPLLWAEMSEGPQVSQLIGRR